MPALSAQNQPRQPCHQADVRQLNPDKTFESSLVDVPNLVSTFSSSPLVLLFCSANQIRDCEQCRDNLSRTFGIPSLYWSYHCRRSNGYFGYEDNYNESGQFTGHSTWSRFLVKKVLPPSGKRGQKDYLWFKFNIFAQWTLSTDKGGLPTQTRLIVFDSPENIKSRLPELLLARLDTLEDLVDPYWTHGVICEELVDLQDAAVWGVRDRVRELEQKRPEPDQPRPSYPKMHDDARHVIHVSETLELAEQVINEMIDQHRRSFFAHEATLSSLKQPSMTIKTIKNVHSKVDSRLRFFKSMVCSLSARSRATNERLKNEMNLAFNTVAQFDSRISVEIGKAAQVDSSAMRTISVVTLAFLPATFVAAIFSTGFFDFDPATPDGPLDQLRVSKTFWVYWAWTIPLTVVTIGARMIWDYYLSPKQLTRGSTSQEGKRPGLLASTSRSYTAFFSTRNRRSTTLEMQNLEEQ